MAEFTAFTVKASSTISKIMLDVSICLATPQPVEDSELLLMKAIIDTGREKTVVSPQLMLQLLSTREGIQKLDQFTLVDIYLPNRIRIAGVPMEIAMLDKGLDCCLGMDIVSLGDLSLSTFGGQTQFSFRVPSCGGEDYVEHHNIQSTQVKPVKKAMVMTGRGAMCPCGSGKKHKNCCAKLH